MIRTLCTHYRRAPSQPQLEYVASPPQAGAAAVSRHLATVGGALPSGGALASATVGAMCGRYVASTPSDVLATFFDVDEVRPELPAASWNVAPTDSVPAVINHGGQRVLAPLSWGLVPFWATDRKEAARGINARAETLATKAAFRRAFLARRCLLPADGYYEWERRADDRKQPWFIHRADRAPMALAGIWEAWRPPDQRSSPLGVDPAPALLTCSIVTTTANETLAPLHDRMPVLIDHLDWEEWLDPNLHDVDLLSRFLVPADDRLLERYAVPTLVNHVANNGPGLLEPVGPPPAATGTGDAPQLLPDDWGDPPVR